MAVAARRALAPSRQAPVRPARARPRVAGPPARARPRPRLARGVVWIALVAALLAGIVALNVAVLQLRMERGRVQADIVQLRAENEKLRSDIASAASIGRIESAARRLGLVEPAETTYVEVDGSGR